MELALQWILFIFGERDPLGSEPLISGERGPIIVQVESGG